MKINEAREQLEKLNIAFSDANFFKYVQAGDAEVVELFLDAGMPPGVRDEGRNSAIFLASRAGQLDVGRLLLARGASPEPLLLGAHDKKDTWDKISASSAVLSFISSLLIAAVGGYFTYSYNERQIQLNRAQSEHDTASKEQANKVLELEAIQKFIPNLTSNDENGKTVALIAIKRLAHPELAADLAQFYGGPGAIKYLQGAAVSGTPKETALAVRALSSLATSGKQNDSQLAARALADVFEQISPGWEKPKPNETQFLSADGECGPTGDGGDKFTNLRRNRTDVPLTYHEVSWKALQSLPYPNAPRSLMDWSGDQLAIIQPYQGIPVSVVGYLLSIKVQDKGSGESTNCHLTKPDEVDWHMPFAERFGDAEATAVVAETTPRIRKEHPKWTAANLSPWVNSNSPVRISGWTLLDPEHGPQIGRFRSTLWEVHPVTKIEVFKDGQWVDCDNLQ